MSILEAMAAALRAPIPAGAPRDVLADLAELFGEVEAQARVETAAADPSLAPARTVIPRQEAGPRGSSVPRVRPVRSAEPEPEAPRPPLRAMVEEQVAAQPERLAWPAWWWQASDPMPATRCRRLWAEVLRGCLLDALAEPEGPRKGRYMSGGVTARAGWIGSRDFHEVAALAGFDGAAVASRLERRLGEGGGRAAVLAALRGVSKPSSGEGPE